MNKENPIIDEYNSANLYMDTIRKDRQVYDGKRMRKPVVRKTIDFYSTIIKNIQSQIYLKDTYRKPPLFPMPDFTRDLLPVSEYLENNSNAFCTKYISTSVNKSRCPVNVVKWTPEGRRLITGTHTGEFTLWNGLLYNFETILQAHEYPIRSMLWTHNSEWMVSADDNGIIKYWQSNMNNVKAFEGHKGFSIRGISFSPSDKKFVTASDEGILKIWDFEKCLTENKLVGHGWDIKSVDWHPQKSLIVSGGKDQYIKLWDPKTGTNITGSISHKHTVSCLSFNKNGNWLISGSRDQTIKLWDVRMLKELKVYKGHIKEVTCLEWHPFHETLFVTGGFDGSIMYWITELDQPQAQIFGAHENSIWDLNWHPLGHVLCTGSSDHTTRFWARNRPGDKMEDKYNAFQLPEEKRAAAFSALEDTAQLNPLCFGHRLSTLNEQWRTMQENVKRTAKKHKEKIPLLGNGYKKEREIKNKFRSNLNPKFNNYQISESTNKTVNIYKQNTKDNIPIKMNIRNPNRIISKKFKNRFAPKFVPISPIRRNLNHYINRNMQPPLMFRPYDIRFRNMRSGNINNPGRYF